MPWTPEEKRRHEVNGHAECDNSCEVCIKTRSILEGILDECIQSHVYLIVQASAFEEADESVTVVSGGLRSECFCRVCTTQGSTD